MSQGALHRLMLACGAYKDITRDDKPQQLEQTTQKHIGLNGSDTYWTKLCADTMLRVEQTAQKHIDINDCRDAFWANYVRTGNYGRPLQCVYGPFTTYGRDIPRDEQFERDIRLAEERPNLSVYLKDFDVLEKNYTDDCDFTEPDTYYFLLRPQLLFELLFE